MESWQQRYFVLEGQEMAYYKHQTHASASEGPRGSIQLASARVSLRADSKVRFDIDDAMGRCWHLCASTEEEAASWVAALKTAISGAEKLQQAGYLQKLRGQTVSR